MVFDTKINLRDSKFEQEPGDVLTLSGTTNFVTSDGGDLKVDGVSIKSLTGSTSSIVERTYALTGTELTVDLDSADVFYMNVSASTIISHSGGTENKQYLFIFIQDTTAKTITWASGKYRFPFGNIPILSDPVSNSGHSEDIVTTVFRKNRLDVVITNDMREN